MYSTPLGINTFRRERQEVRLADEEINLFWRSDKDVGYHMGNSGVYMAHQSYSRHWLWAAMGRLYPWARWISAAEQTAEISSSVKSDLSGTALCPQMGL